MNFTRQTWEEQSEQKYKQLNRLSAWLRRQSQPAGLVTYGSVAAFTIWPLVQAVTAAAATGQSIPLPVITALGAVLGNLGSNLLAGQLQTWYENTKQGHAPKEQEVIKWLASNVLHQSDLKAEIDRVLEELQALPRTQVALPAEDWTTLARQLQADMQRLATCRASRRSSSFRGKGIKSPMTTAPSSKATWAATWSLAAKRCSISPTRRR